MISNSFPVSDTAADRATDQLNGADQLEQTPPYPSVGDWIYGKPNKKYPGEVCYAKEFVNSEGDRCRYKDQVGTVIFPHLNT